MFSGKCSNFIGTKSQVSYSLIYHYIIKSCILYNQINSLDIPVYDPYTSTEGLRMAIPTLNIIL